jgi:hypothetical protein
VGEVATTTTRGKAEIVNDVKKKETPAEERTRLFVAEHIDEKVGWITILPSTHKIQWKITLPRTIDEHLAQVERLFELVVLAEMSRTTRGDTPSEQAHLASLARMGPVELAVHASEASRLRDVIRGYRRQLDVPPIEAPPRHPSMDEVVVG